MAQDGTRERQEMATLLRSKTEKILADWEATVRARVPADQLLGEAVLRDSLHLLLENLADALEQAAWPHHLHRNAEIAVEHALQRHHLQKHKFGEVVDEYAELRRAIIHNVAGESATTPLGTEAIHAFIDASIKHAGGYFVELRNRDEKRELVAARDLAQNQRDGLEGERDSIRGYATALEQERQLRSEVISMLGHDMRTPLTAALLAAEMLARSPQSLGKSPQRLERIIEGLQRLNAMIKNLLDADRLRTGAAHPIEVGFCDLAAVLEKTHHGLTAVHGKRFVTNAPTEMTGYWDCIAIQRVLENLANNAVKYGSDVEAIQLQLKQAGDQVELSVHNAGPPIPSESLPSLFTPRFRTDEAGRSAVTGWGLGLAQVRAAVEAHGGTASVESSASAGTTFYVRLPLDCRSTGPHAASRP